MCVILTVTGFTIYSGVCILHKQHGTNSAYRNFYGFQTITLHYSSNSTYITIYMTVKIACTIYVIIKTDNVDQLTTIASGR